MSKDNLQENRVDFKKSDSREISCNYNELKKKTLIAMLHCKRVISIYDNNTEAEIEVTIEEAREVIRTAKKIYAKAKKQIVKIPKELEEYLVDANAFFRKVNQKIVGREEEIERIYTHLSSMQKRNCILIGKQGVGKESIIIEVIRQINFYECPQVFWSSKVLFVNLKKMMMIETCKKRNKVIKDMLKFVSNQKNIILFSNDLLGFKRETSLIYALYDIITAYDIPFIASIVPDDYENYFAQDNTINKYINEILVEEPDFDELYEILSNKANNYQEAGVINISEEILKFVMLTSYYLTSSNAENPESSIDTLNYAITRAKQKGKENLEKEDVLAYYKIDFKFAKKMNFVDKKTTAYHETGHYLVRKMSPNIKGRENAFVSILPIGDSLGINADYFKFENQTNFDKEYYIDNIAYCLGGRVAEKEYTNSETSGACEDLITATSLAEKLVLSYGLSEESSKNRSYTNGEYLKTFLLTDELRKEMNTEINKIISEAYSRAEKIIKENSELLERIVECLLKDGVLTGEELDKICDSDS